MTGKKTWQGNQQLTASYTVEAALLMGILLPVLAAIIYMGFYLHDRGFLQGAAHEAASCLCLKADDQTANLMGAVEALPVGRTLGAPSISAQVNPQGRQISVVYEGSLQLPGMTADFFGQGALTVRSGVTLTVERPSARIQKIRGLHKVINSVRRVRE